MDIDLLRKFCMNQRIKQLANQAGRKECAIGYGMPENVLWGDNRIEAFAELIIRECIGYLSSEASRLNELAESEHREIFRDDFLSCAEKCLDNIQGLKTHFEIQS